MTKEQVQQFASTHVWPIVALGLRAIPAKHLATILLGYGVTVARRAGWSEDTLRGVFEAAMQAGGESVGVAPDVTP